MRQKVSNPQRNIRNAVTDEDFDLDELFQTLKGTFVTDPEPTNQIIIVFQTLKGTFVTLHEPHGQYVEDFSTLAGITQLLTIQT